MTIHSGRSRRKVVVRRAKTRCKHYVGKASSTVMGAIARDEPGVFSAAGFMVPDPSMALLCIDGKSEGP